MAGRSVQSGARALLFDRLSESTTEGPFEATPLRFYSIEEVQSSVAKEVSDLLNTRRSAASFDADIASSTIAYGIGDYAGFSFKSARDLRYIAQDIEKAIKRYGALNLETKSNNLLLIFLNFIDHTFTCAAAGE